jgi:hypothetical protein
MIFSSIATKAKTGTAQFLAMESAMTAEADDFYLTGRSA